ncbi:hypothetical protein [Streptomyces sp. NPDC020983]|uniref:hypothetical protein n=1 Tax=Streptomyces sp. NPDC020983 TaxID=3365106 RepID=UPI003794FB53
MDASETRAWLGPDIPAELNADFRRDVFTPISVADRVYYLRELDDAEFHDWGGVHDQFHEFILVSRRAARITLLVAADD